MFIVLSSLKSGSSMNTASYKLRKGDIVKLGRIKFKVKEIKTEQSYSPVKNGAIDDDYELGTDEISEEFIEIDCAIVDETSSEHLCKVCWSNE